MKALAEIAQKLQVSAPRDRIGHKVFGMRPTQSTQRVGGERCYHARFAHERFATFFGKLIKDVAPVAVLAERGCCEDDIALRQPFIRNERSPETCRDCGLARTGRTFDDDYSFRRRLLR